MSEAADLGVRLVQQHAGALLRCAGPVYALVALLALALLPLAWWAPWLLLMLAKPWWDRTLLFVLARALFGEDTRWADLRAAQRSVWWQGLLQGLTQRRLSPWRSFTQPVVQLEGLVGAPQRRRRAQIRQRHQAAALAMAGSFWIAETAIGVGIPATLLWLVPGGEMGQAWVWFSGAGETGTNLLFTVAYIVAVAVVEPFFVGAGFAMYLNRRVELEAWDVEQALRHAFAPA